MKLIVKYDGGQTEDKDYHITICMEYMFDTSEFIGSGYNHETNIRDLEFEVSWPPLNKGIGPVNDL